MYILHIHCASLIQGDDSEGYPVPITALMEMSFEPDSSISVCYFSIQPVLHDWCNKGRGMCYPVWDGAYKRTLAVNR